MANRVQSAGAAYGNSASARTVATASDVTAGNLIVVCVAIFNTGVTLTVTDSLGNTYAQAGSYAASTTTRSAIFYAYNIIGGACTVTVTPSATAFLNITVLEYSGVITTSPIDATSTNTGTSGTCTAGSVTITDATALMVASFSHANVSGNEVKPSGSLGVARASNDMSSQFVTVLDGVVSAAENPTVVRTTSSVFAAVGASFKITQAAGAQNPFTSTFGRV